MQRISPEGELIAWVEWTVFIPRLKKVKILSAGSLLQCQKIIIRLRLNNILRDISKIAPLWLLSSIRRDFYLIKDRVSFYRFRCVFLILMFRQFMTEAYHFNNENNSCTSLLLFIVMSFTYCSPLLFLFTLFCWNFTCISVSRGRDVPAPALK